jgi:dephospho-CoA kinase
MILGITGGVGTGKSAVASILAQLGARVIDCDVIAHYLTSHDPSVLSAIVSTFGSESLTAHGALDRRRLGEIVFADPRLRHQLEQILHPPIAGVVQANAQWAKMSAHPLVVVIPLLYEAGMENLVEVVWVVTASREQQVERQLMRDGLDREQAQKRIDAQLPLEQKKSMADLVIDNSGTLEDLRARVPLHWEALTVHHD